MANKFFGRGDFFRVRASGPRFWLDLAVDLAQRGGMMVFEARAPLAWGSLDLPILGLDRDWFGLPLWPPAGFSLVIDPQRLWFAAGQNRPAQVHPAALPGLFKAQLWRHDVAELFLGDPGSGAYLEFHLAPNAAWWSCRFDAPRIRTCERDVPLAGVETWANTAEDGSWMAVASIPLEVLVETIAFGPATTANIAFILESPRQRFLSVEDLGLGDPDFHRPDGFTELEYMSIVDSPAPAPAADDEPAG